VISVTLETKTINKIIDADTPITAISSTSTLPPSLLTAHHSNNILRWELSGEMRGNIAVSSSECRYISSIDTENILAIGGSSRYIDILIEYCHAFTLVISNK
jgi:hypothetical protein